MGLLGLIGLVLMFLGVILLFILLGGGEFFAGTGTSFNGDECLLYEPDLSGVFYVEVLGDITDRSLINFLAGLKNLPLLVILNVINTNLIQ